MKKQATKAFAPRDPEKYAYAEQLYMQQLPQGDIAKRVGVSEQTLSKWKTLGQWDQKRTAKMISRDTLMAKLMQQMSDMLDKGADFNADAFAKAAKQVKELQKGAAVDDIIESLSRFGDWLIREAKLDLSITTDFVQLVTALQDRFLAETIKSLGQ